MQQHDRNHLGQPIGFAVPNWEPPQRPPRQALEGRLCRVEPFDVEKHAAPLFDANSRDREGGMWTYMAYGPFDTLEQYRAWMRDVCAADDPMFFAIIVEGKPVGVATYMRINPKAGSIEVGNIAYSPLLSRTPAATEAMFLMMKQAFELGYRRYEWKCNALNAPSRAAAKRLGFLYEGEFRQSDVVKGRSRDTTWFSIVDSEWPALRGAFERWLSPANFDAQGRQKEKLSDLTQAVRAA